MSQRTTADAAASDPPTAGQRQKSVLRRIGKGGIAAAAAVALSATLASTALATTAVVKKNPGGITVAGPVNTRWGFPAWYQDSKNIRTELCLDGNDPMCGFVAAPVEGFDNTAPTVFPDPANNVAGNFPDEAFYMSAGSSLTLPNGGKATLTLGVEAAFLNAVQNGDQITFARQRIFVVGGPPSTTLHFHHPYGDIDIDTDAAGKGRITEDIAPSVGNFDGVLKGNIGPFLTWDTGPVTTDSGSYLGDPAIEHLVTGSPLNYNKFGVDWPDGTKVENDQFSLLGKIAKNTGVKADAAIQSTGADGKAVVDVFASSEADPNELYVAEDKLAGIKTTPMAASAETGPKTFYARVAVTGNPANITVKNVGDAPTSSSQVAVTKASPVTVTNASYDGKTLHVEASSATNKPLTVSGYAGATLTATGVDITTGAPPATVTVTDGTDKGTAPVHITGGPVSESGEPPVPAGPPVDAQCTILDPATGLETTGSCPVGGPAPTASPTAKVAAVTTPVVLGDSVVLDASTSTNATSYEWTSISGVNGAAGPAVTFTNGTTAKPTAKLTPYDVSKYALATLPKAAQNTVAKVQVVAINGTTRSPAVTLDIPVKVDTALVTATKYTAGKEYRVDGTSLTGGTQVLNPPTSVAIYNTTTGKLVTTGLVQVDTAGAWSFRPRAPFAAGQDLARNITVVTSRGGYTTNLVAGAPN